MLFKQTRQAYDKHQPAEEGKSHRQHDEGENFHYENFRKNWSERRDSNSRHSPWQGDAKSSESAANTGAVDLTAPDSNARSNITAKNSRFIRVQQNIYRYATTGILYAVFRVNGKLKWRSLKTAKLREAKRLLLVEMDKAEKTADPIKKDMSFGELLALYEINLCGFALGTQRNRRSILKILRETWPCETEMKVSRITRAHLKNWLTLQSPRMKAVSLKDYLKVLRGIFNLAVDARVIADSPADEIKLPRPENPVRLTPTWEQALQLIAAVRSEIRNARAEHSADFLEFMLLAGIGIAEARNLCGQHISIESDQITLFRQKTKTGFTIPIFPQLKPLVNRLRDAGRLQPNVPVFEIKNARKALVNTCAKLGLPEVSSRALRRCFITRAIENGVDFKTISHWQGHKDGGALIAKVYSHLRSEHSTRMALLLK